MKPSPRHSKCGRSAKTSAITSRARALPSHGTTRLYWFSTSQRPSRSCDEDHLDRLQDVEGLEAGDHHRLAVRARDELERPGADHGRDVARADEAVEPQVRRVEQRAQRRHDRHVAAQAAEVADALRLRPAQRERGRGRGGLEADGEEHDLAPGIRLGDPQRVERRVDHPHVGALRLGVEQRAVRARHAHHVAEAGEDDAGLAGHGDAVVHPPHGDHAHRAAGPVHQLDVGRQQVVDPVLVDRVRVAAADLHDLVVAARLDGRQDLAGQRPAELGVAELVHEPHTARPGPRRRAPADRRRAAPAPPARSPRCGAPRRRRRTARGRARRRAAAPASARRRRHR